MANYVDITPIMTSNMGSGGYKTNASSEIDSKRQAWMVFNGVNATQKETGYWHASENVPQWITMQFPEAVKVDKFSVKNCPALGGVQYKGITAFQLQGSNDGAAFDTLGTYTSDGATGALNEFVVTNPGYYQHYRLYITATAFLYTYYYVVIDQIRFYSLAGESMGGNVNIGGVRHTLPNGYVNISGAMHKLLRGYVNIGGVLHLMYQGEASSRLPSGYKEVESIYSNGSQYIDTGFKPTGNTRVVMDHESFSVSSGYPTMFGCRSSSGSNAFACHYSAGTSLCYMYYHIYTPSFTVNNPWGRHTVDVNKGQLYRDGLLIGSQPLQSFTSTLNLYLFTLNYGGTIPSSHNSPLRLYSCQVYDNGTLVRDFVPCKNPSGAVGLFDLVNSVFYANKGSGSFTAGAEV